MKKYGILSIIFLLFSLLGGVFLVRNNQDNRNRATPGDKCSEGQELCQENAEGKNTGFLCTCLTFLDPNDWRCTTPDLNRCPTESGGTDPSNFTCTEANVKIEGRCLKAITGTMSVVNKYQCPDRYDTAGGCQDNVQTLRNVTSVCFDDNFCGVQQIDFSSKCFISTIDYCQSPTSVSSPTPSPRLSSTPTPRLSSTPTPRLTSTPTPTPRPTSTPRPTLTPRPTSTPTPTPTPTTGPSPTPTPLPTSTPTPTAGPSPTPGPSSTPTPSQSPTNTPIPTSVIAQGPSPTRIILPESGIEFPSQMLTIIGGIITLLGFLILL